METCDNCTNCVLRDYGYSNYTVEGTGVYCGLKLLPNDGFDRWYGEDERLKFAEQCPSFDKGEPVYIDVDQEEVPSLTEAQLKLYNNTL